ncbi:hypothetical protein LAZ67_14003491, partial [Cordylochernes scorpioides]
MNPLKPPPQKVKLTPTYQCHECEAQISMSVKMMSHYLVHMDHQLNPHLAEITRCMYCYKSFTSPYTHQFHLQKHHLKEEGRFHCRICLVAFTSTKELLQHMATLHHRHDMPYICKVCGFRSSFHMDIVEHFAQEHAENNHLLCQFCLRVYTPKISAAGLGITRSYLQHMAGHCNSKVSYRCSRCALVFLNDHTMRLHRRTEHYYHPPTGAELTPYTSPHPPEKAILVPAREPPNEDETSESRLEFYGLKEDVLCMECHEQVDLDHFRTTRGLRAVMRHRFLPRLPCFPRSPPYLGPTCCHVPHKQRKQQDPVVIKEDTSQTVHALPCDRFLPSLVWIPRSPPLGLNLAPVCRYDVEPEVHCLLTVKGGTVGASARAVLSLRVEPTSFDTDPPATIRAFQQWLKDEGLFHKPIHWLLRNGLLKMERRKCPICHSQLSLEPDPLELDGYSWRCLFPKCSLTFPIHRPRFFVGFGLSMERLLRVCCQWALQLGPGETDEVHMVRTVFRGLQDLCGWALSQNLTELLPGPVEVGAAQLGHFWVLGAYDRKLHTARLQAVASLSEVDNLVSSWVAPSATIVTDGVDHLSSYLSSHLSSMFGHLVVTQLTLRDIQGLLDELQWREFFGSSGLTAFWNIFNHIAHFSDCQVDLGPHLLREQEEEVLSQASSSDQEPEEEEPVGGEELVRRKGRKVPQCSSECKYPEVPTVLEEFYYAKMNPLKPPPQKVKLTPTYQGYGGAVSVLMLESAAKASASMLGTASNYRQSQTFTKVCLDHGAMINESCTPIPHSMRSDVDLHAASPVAQNKQGRVQDLGRGFCPISIIQSPQTSHFATSKQLSILQCNINGLCSTATKIKLEEIMEIAEKQKIQIIALQETKLNEKYNLKYKNYNILRKDRNKEGGGLAFLIKNLYYEDIAINIPNTSDLEAQGIKQNTNEDFRKAPTRIKDLEQNWISFKNTIIKAAKVSIPRDYALENTDLNKTPGPDGIHGQMISNLGKNGKEKLLDIFNNSWKTGKLPQDWKTATIIPIKKLDKSADDPKNYRPISLTKQQLQYNKHPKYLGYTLDPEINSSKHIEEVIRKGRDRLKILKYISGREWGADATTLKLTYTSLIRPILEYGYQIYGTASETNLKSLERIQLSAARIITGLRNTCPNDIVLYEADIMPLKDRRSYNLPKYINKIKSYGNKHRTSKYILNWESNLRLKKEGPLHLAKRNEFLKYKVEKNYLAEKISPCKPLQNVIFNATLNEPTNKQYQNPEYLKQLSLEIINNIPKNAITIYTDGSRDELGHTGSGCLIKTTNGIEKMNRRNPDFCSVFRSELIAIYEALKSIRNTNYQDIWILTDSRSALQHLSHTGELRDKCHECEAQISMSVKMMSHYLVHMDHQLNPHLAEITRCMYCYKSFTSPYTHQFHLQ